MRPLPPKAATRARRLLARLARAWALPALATVEVGSNFRLSRTLARFVTAARRIETSPRALRLTTLDAILTHEAAHAALALAGVAAPRPHGPEWRRLMTLAGIAHPTAALWRCRPTASARKPAPKPTRPSATRARYEHWCPVCQSSRTAARPVKAWRCRACVQAGLPGTLEITRG
ncbi:MAG: SprT-like domain-containing protein [Vicinamibacteria bacterium]|nr:SprT-like domain-containing protein [Vicinamibacteria bacterium]